MRTWVCRLALVALLPLLPSCSGDAGDCNVKIRYDDSVYQVAAMVRTPRAADPLGPAEYGDCDGSKISWAKPGELWSVSVDPDLALLLREPGTDDVLYVNEDIAPRDWPELVKTAGRYPECERPSTFTGTWDLVDAAHMPNMDEYNVPVPYSGVFTARRGSGLHFDEWSIVKLRARFATDTIPHPSADFKKRALADNQLVLVTTQCRGTRFEVATIRFVE